MEKEIEYQFNCSGCQKADKDFPISFDNYDYGEPIYNAPRVSEHKWARNDAYGIYTGLYCDKCYKHNYPYKRGRYHDESYCGERLEPNE
tara:strand:- start:138 stop:404 length:267 start_codon:yes stop_codon:yes gene_type:complete